MFVYHKDLHSCLFFQVDFLFCFQYDSWKLVVLVTYENKTGFVCMSVHVFEYVRLESNHGNAAWRNVRILRKNSSRANVIEPTQPSAIAYLLYPWFIKIQLRFLFLSRRSPPVLPNNSIKYLYKVQLQISFVHRC